MPSSIRRPNRKLDPPGVKAKLPVIAKFEIGQNAMPAATLPAANHSRGFGSASRLKPVTSHSAPITATHMAAAGMCVAVIGALWLVTGFKRLALPKPRLWFAAGSVAAGIAFCPISNFAITGSFAFTPGGSSFLFGRLIEDGIVARYLADQCPDASLRLCDYKATLPEDADDWLWDGNSPFRILGDVTGFGDEERAIIMATLQRYP